MPAGRPSDYKPAYVDLVIEHLSQGYSLTAFAGTVGASRPTVYAWADANPQFLNAIKIGRAKGQQLWEERLANQAMTGAGNTAAIIFAMKNLYQDDWTDRVVNELTGKDGGPIETKDVSARDAIASKLTRLAARGGTTEDPIKSDGSTGE